MTFIPRSDRKRVYALLSSLLTKLKIAWWLRRKWFALGRLAVIIVSMFVSILIVLLLVMT